MDKNEVKIYNEIISASSRFRPKETIFFNPPLIGLNGNILESYTWSYEWDMRPNWEGELVSYRRSDWTQAEASGDTGRDIVHKYDIKTTDGNFKTVSSESVPILLGLIDRTQKTRFGNLATASKTLAKQKLKLSILLAQKKQYDELTEFYKNEKKPAIEYVERTIDDLSFIFYKYRSKEEQEEKLNEYSNFRMGNVTEEQENKQINGAYEKFRKFQINKIPSEYTKERLIKNWIWKNVELAGGIYPRDLYDLQNRVERQERRVNEIIKKANDESIKEKKLKTLEISLKFATDDNKAKIEKLISQYK
jgi:hypothetical protein